MIARQGWLIPETWLEKLLVKDRAVCMRPYSYGFLVGTIKSSLSYAGHIRNPQLTLIDYIISRNLIWIHPYIVVPWKNFWWRVYKSKRLKE